MELPFDPDMPIPEDMPEGMKEILKWAKDQQIREEMSMEDVRNKMREELLEGMSLTQLHVLAKMLETIMDAENPGKAASFYTGMLTGFGVSREHFTEQLCELCAAKVPAGLEEL